MEKLQPYLNVAWDSGIEIGKNILAAILIFIVGRLLISFIKKIVTKALNKRQNMDEGIKSFVKSLVNVTLTVLLLDKAIRNEPIIAPIASQSAII